MGDRANVQFTMTRPTADGDELAARRPAPLVNLYSHNHGVDLFHAVQTALDSKAARIRWDDPPYCCRVVVQRTLELLGARSDEDGGFGLWTSVDDNSHEIMLVDFADGGWVTLGVGRFRFDEFCMLDSETIEQLAE